MYYAMNTYILEREKRWFERVREMGSVCLEYFHHWQEEAH